MSALEIMLEKAYDEGKKEAEAELNRTKRALWLARAEMAKIKAYRIWKDNSLYLASKLDDFLTYPLFVKWQIAERKCRAYADKFKEE